MINLTQDTFNVIVALFNISRKYDSIAPTMAWRLDADLQEVAFPLGAAPYKVQAKAVRRQFRKACKLASVDAISLYSQLADCTEDETRAIFFPKYHEILPKLR